MIYIRTDSNNMVIFKHSQPFDPINGLGETKEELEKSGFLIESMPIAQTIVGKRAIPYFNPESKQITFKYSASPISSHERLEILESAFNELIMNMLDNTDETDSAEDSSIQVEDK